MIAFRVVQGIGGGLMLPILQTLLLRAADRERIGRLMAVVTLPALIGPILGPVIGGVLVGHLDWRWIFYVNVPICIAAITLAVRTLDRDPAPTAARLDVLGLLLVSPALAAIIYGLSQVGDQGFGHTAVLGGAFGAATLAVILQSQLPGHAASTAYAHSFGWAIGFTIVAAVPALLLPRRRTLE